VHHVSLWQRRSSTSRSQGSATGPVAEVLIGLLAGDPLSYLRVKPNWKPDLGDTPGQFAMPDLIRFAGAA